MKALGTTGMPTPSPLRTSLAPGAYGASLFEGILICLAWSLFTAITPAQAELRSGHLPSKSARSSPTSDGQFVLGYADAIAKGHPAEWADRDLGCLSRHRDEPSRLASPHSERDAMACAEATFQAHRNLVADIPEAGIFGAVGRGAGFGMLSERHRQSDLWREYPPAVFVSPVVARSHDAPAPTLRLSHVWDSRTIPLVLSPGTPARSVRGIAVDLVVTYPDPLKAPLALRPGEVRWASGGLRQYGPVREVIARFILVSGLRKLGYPVDRAVVNEALPGAPTILGAHYGLSHDPGRTVGRGNDETPDPLGRGGLVLGSARWWERTQAGPLIDAALMDAQQAATPAERAAKLARLLLLDREDPDLNARLGDALYLKLLSEGLARSGIQAQESEEARLRLAELYWNLQAQTWRQELTAVDTGYEPAADALYGAIAALDIAATASNATLESRRRLGALYRWNNEAQSALQVHEPLLRQIKEAENSELRGPVLAELAWDRIQWVSWNRRYDHPWLGQAKEEALTALGLAVRPADKLMAAQALVMVEALAVPRDGIRLQEAVRVAREWHDRLAGIDRLWTYLIGNDVVRALLPEAQTVALPRPPRQPDVLPTITHATPPKQDLLRAWDFDGDQPGAFPAGFGASTGESQAWQVKADPQAHTPPHVLTHAPNCQGDGCWRMLLGEEVDFEFPDVTLHFRQLSEQPEGGAGIVLAAKDGKTFYTVTVNVHAKRLAIHRIVDGRAELLGEEPIAPATSNWHILRIQWINFLHVSRPRLATFFDRKATLAVTEEAGPRIGRVGLVVKGRTEAQFDSLHLLSLVSNQSLSRPAAY